MLGDNGYRFPALHLVGEGVIKLNEDRFSGYILDLFHWLLSWGGMFGWD